MDKKNYRESLEKDRQEINAESTSNLSRRAHRQPANQKTPKVRNVLLPALFSIFILIPVSVLIYVVFFYVPDDTLTDTTKNANEVSFETVAPTEESTVIVPEEAEEEEAEVAEETEEPAGTETEAKEEEKAEGKEETAKPDPVEEEVETEKPDETTVTPVQTPAVETQEPAGAQKTVVVKENETLYRIAVNNYGASGAGAAVEKIKQANGMSSNEIYPGQTLILP